ncbi:DUF6907 domain-containing protein [Streptomyces sp. OR43]|uniref:DUF6907 domain-containing protein n=1 Tax=Streptomyces sp. or43 TaxID=2478957 RepID=UPI0011CDD76A|nr:hypothetical protein [Streptomyces sp. or43]TXS35740.1 hypothetical protein EAO72_19165 [Streptomyces sp. or43]
MSEDRPIVAPQPRRNADGTTTVTAIVYTDIRLTCPDWCIVEHGYPHPPAKTEITHRGDPEWALVETPETGPTSLVQVGLVQWPFSDQAQVFLAVETDDGHKEVGPTGARRIAAALRAHADHIDAMAAKLEAIRAGESQ